MNIIFIINNLGFGGAEKMATFVANSLAKRGHIVTLFVLNDTSSSYQQLDEKIRLYCYNKEQKTNTFLQYYEWARFFAPLAKKIVPDVLISFLGIPNLVCVLLAKILHIPSIISERGDPCTAFNDGRFVTKLLLWLYNHSSGAVFQTLEASLFYDKKLQKRSVIIPNPIVLSGNIPEINYKSLPKTIVYLGRLDNYQKRLDILLMAFNEFYRSHSDYKLVIFGRGPAQSDIEAYINEHNLTGSVELKGVSRASMNDLSQHGIFVITSDFEGISNSLLEAMAIGMPVVTTDHSPGGGRLLVQDHINGLLVPVRDPHAIANALSEFANDAELREKCGREATKVLLRFEPMKIIDMWESYIKELKFRK